MENIKSWKDIRWKTIEENVFRLQLRIYKAATNREIEKMYKIQKLLISSKSAKYLSVRKVSHQNYGKKTPRVDKFTLAERLALNRKSSSIKRTYIDYPNGKRRPLEILTIEDKAKQMLAYLALYPQWEASFESASDGFRPGRSVQDAMEAIFLEISKKPKWVLDAYISTSFEEINHQYLLEKCNTYPEMQSQLRVWLKAGILDREEYAFSVQGGIISPLLFNIALHGIQETLDKYINSLGGHCRNNRQAFKYFYSRDDSVFMHADKKVIEGSIPVIQNFLEPIGLELHPTKTRLVHTLKSYEGKLPGFTFLGFDINQIEKQVKMRAVYRKHPSKQTFVTLIKPSKEGVKRHKRKLREVIRRSRGISQERLIQKLNRIIRSWSLSKRTQISSKMFQTMDRYVFFHLWKWARKRHPKMSRYKLKEKYWHKVGSRNWVFGVKRNDIVSFQLQLHSKIIIKRFAKIKGKASPFDGNRIYWAKRCGKSLIIPNIQARLIKEQNGRCGLCGKAFLPEDIIERDHIIPKALEGKNLITNIHAVHNYCHIEKTNSERLQIRRNRKLVK